MNKGHLYEIKISLLTYRSVAERLDHVVLHGVAELEVAHGRHREVDQQQY